MYLKGLHVHERCYITLSSKRPLQQSRKRKEKENAENYPTTPEQQDLLEKECQPSSPKRLQSSTGETFYHNKCVWCMKGSDKKILLENWKIDANISSFGMERI